MSGVFDESQALVVVRRRCATRAVTFANVHLVHFFNLHHRCIIRAMQTLRNAHLLARFVLVWFALSIGVAMASPIVKPQAMELICTGTVGVMKVLIQTDDGPQEVSVRTLDCPLCAAMSAPPPVARLTPEPVQALAYVMQSIPAAHIASLTGAPPPARGPPAFS